MKYDVIAIGSATRDVFMNASDFVVIDDKEFSLDEIEKLMKGIEEIKEKLDKGKKEEGEEEGESQTASTVTFPMTMLVRLAYSNPDARPVLLAMIREAAKKKKKGNYKPGLNRLPV